MPPDQQTQEQQVATPESVVGTPEPAAKSPGTVEAGTTEQAAETEEQQAERVSRDEQAKARRAMTKLNRRFGEITSQRDQLALQNQQLMQMLLQQGGQARGPQGTPQGNPDERPPAREDYADYDSFMEARAEWTARRTVQREIEAARRSEDEQQRRHMARMSAEQAKQEFVRGQESFAKEHPDYHDVLANSEAQLPDGIEDVFIRVPESYIAAYVIAQNPKLAEQFWGKSRDAAASLMGSIIASYKARPAPQVSNAPPPGKPVSAKGAGSGSTPSDNDSVEEWMRKRNAEIAKRGG